MPLARLLSDGGRRLRGLTLGSETDWGGPIDPAGDEAARQGGVLRLLSKSGAWTWTP